MPALAACVTTASSPDLVVSRLDVSPARVSAGSVISIASGVENRGGAPTDRPVSMEIALYADALSNAPIAPLTTWRQNDGESLAAGAGVEDVEEARLSPALKPGFYAVCGEVDPFDEIGESDETNNRSCAPFEILAGPPRLSDLVVESVTAVGPVEASLKVKIKIRNAGSAAAGPFRVMAFRRNPRQPILLIECPLTEGQLSAGSPASCADLTQRTPLGGGESAELIGYVSYVVAGGANLIRNPVGRGPANPAKKRSIDIMVDGCFPPEDGSPVHCAVEEIDEINNFKGATLTLR